MIVQTIASIYRPLYVKSIVYMLQSTEYDVVAYLRWFWRTSDFSKIMHRRTLVPTKVAKLLLLALRLGIWSQYALAAGLAVWGIKTHSVGWPLLAVAVFMIAPIVWAYLIVVPLLVGKYLINGPYTALQTRKAAKIFAAHPGIKIAIAGSYGKTTMKEILLAVLGEGKKVAATPANRNVSISHAQFAKSLRGDEKILIIEYGEGAPGDVARFSHNTHPNIGIITGLAPAHLDKYKTLNAAGKDIFELARYLESKNVYVNTDSPDITHFMESKYHAYNSKEVLGWKISDIKTTISGTSFAMSKNHKHMKLSSRLLGESQVGVLAMAAALALELGLSEDKVKAGIAKTKPFEHRMQPRPLGGGWLIDDTYNGNIQGMLAGLRLLKSLPAKRKIYVTPGLVDQGEENVSVHNQLGEAIARTNPDMVVLMKNSVTNLIKHGIDKVGYKGELRIEDDPLSFYTNIEHFMAAGDLILMQNDWPDNYY